MRHHRSASPAAPLSADGGLVNALWVFLFVLFLYAGVPSVARAQNCVPGTTPDWMTADDPLAAPVRPAECSAVEQSPPDFGWPAVAGTYQFTLTYPGGATKSVTTPRNWLNWAEVLPAGTYTWQVTANGVSSRSREFTVPANATPFVVPAMSTVLSGLSSKARPRSLPDSATLATMKSQRSSAVNALLSDVKSKTRETLPGGAGGDGKVYGDAALQAIAAAAYSQQGVYYNEAVRRVTNLASWDPKGISSYASNADGAQTVALALAVGYDWLYGRLSQSQRNGILAALKVRVADMHAGVMPSEARPRDALAIQGLAKASVIAAILAHDLPEAATWLNATLPLALNLVSPWSGDDGGFSNGVAEGFQELGGQLFPWYLLRWSTGIDVAKKAWVRNWARYMTYFSPIGTPSNVFGDGLEIAMDENRARFSKGYTFFAPTPLARWYASKLSGENQTRLEYLMAPPDDGTAATFPAATPNTLLLRSTGQIAMHSDLANPARTSVYFKSSPPPHGAFDHGHADQNSFVINSGGQRLAVESGYYDSYKSAHWTDWYHQTRSKNAITYDGGKGQAYYEQGGKVGYGRIVRYVSGSDHEVVTGDATQAYGGALTKATRSMVYLRPNLIVVHDNLASDIARQWEWNIHTLNAMSVASDSKIAIENGGQKLCVEVLGGPARRFEQTDRFTTEPSGTRPRQWHGKFYSTEMLAATEFIVLLNVGCAATTASAAKSNGVWTVNVNDKAIQISDSGISVGAGSGSEPTADTTAPSVPTGLTAAAVSSSQINLNWNASTDNVAVTGYYVYLNDKPLGTTTSTSYSHTGLTAGTTYNYRVSAYDAVPNHSAWTASVAATTSSGSNGGSGGTQQGDTGGLPVIPGASGFGINTKAGRGGTVYRVTNLNASGSGSLAACAAASGPRVCIFEVSGTIHTTSNINIRNPYITIAGQTAPSPGITIRGAGISIATHDVLVQHLRVRPGDASTGPDPINRDAFMIEVGNSDSYNVVLDHLSASWGTDELISVWGWTGGKIYDVTVRNSIMSEALYNSISPDGAHSTGLIVGYRSSRVTVINNLFAYNGNRNPLIRDDSTDVMIVNNMIYRTRGFVDDQINFGSRGSGNVPMRTSVQGNHFVLAPGTSSTATIHIDSNSPSSFQIFVKDNTGPRMTSDPWSVVSSSRSKSSIYVSTPPVWAPGVVPMASSSVETYVLSSAGARPLDRDPVDKRVVSQVQNRTGNIIDSPSQVGGYPTLAVNVRALTLPANPDTVTASGYTNLELWLHEMAKAVEGN